MIRSFRHKGLERLFEKGEGRGVQAQQAARIERILDLLYAAERIEELDVPGFGLHPLKGTRKGEWAMKVSGNWRVTFRFADGEASDVNLEDYH
jgi:proteic killer suppression protein